MTIAANRLRRTQTGASTSDVFEVTSKVFVKQAASLLLKKRLGALPDVTCALHNRPILSKGVALQQLCTRKLQRKLQICTGMILRPNKAPYAQEHTVLGHVCRKQHGHEHMQSGQLVPDSCQHTDAFLFLSRCKTQPLRRDGLAHHDQQKSIPLALVKTFC